MKRWPSATRCWNRRGWMLQTNTDWRKMVVACSRWVATPRGQSRKLFLRGDEGGVHQSAAGEQQLLPAVEENVSAWVSCGLLFLSPPTLFLPRTLKLLCPLFLPCTPLSIFHVVSPWISHFFSPQNTRMAPTMSDLAQLGHQSD